MEKKKNNLLFIACLFILTIQTSCCQSLEQNAGSTKIGKDFIFPYDELKLVDEAYPKDKTKKIWLRFLNNPFNLNEHVYEIVLTIYYEGNKYIIYKGSFFERGGRNGADIGYPLTLLGKADVALELYIVNKLNKTLHSYIPKEGFDIVPDADAIDICFFPSNDYPERIHFFSRKFKN